MQYTAAPEVIGGDPFGPTYFSYSKSTNYLNQFPGEMRGFFESEYEDFQKFFNLDGNQIEHRILYPNDKADTYIGSFDKEPVVEHLKTRANDKGTQRGYRVFRRFTDRLQYPFVLAVDDGVLLLAGGEIDTDEWAWFEYVASAADGSAPRLLEENEHARKAYAPMAGAGFVRSSVYTPVEARQNDGVLEGVRVWSTGLFWEDGQVRLKSPLVYGEGFEVDADSICSAFEDYAPTAPYDYEVRVDGQVAFLTGTAPISKFDFFSKGSPKSTYEDPDEQEREDYVSPPDNTEWSFETDYEAEETTVTYESGPTLVKRRLLGVALNNGSLYETQFREKYKRPIEPGDSITIRTPPSQAGEWITVSWLSAEPYFVLSESQLPEPDSAAGSGG